MHRPLLAAFLLIGLAAVPAAAEFRAACLQIDLTPDTPQWLHGYQPRKSDGVHDRIYHRIAALDDGANQFFLVATDICTVSPAYYDAMTRQLEAETGITRDHIWWTATHTHSAPHVGPQDLGQLFGGTLGDRFSIDHDTAYWDRVTRALIDGVKEARAKLEPARLGIAVGEAKANVNRREWRDGKVVLGVNPDGPVDRQLAVIRLERPDGSLIGLIANYAIHGTALSGGNTKISGDVTGFAALYVEAKVGVPMLFVNGAEGNVAPLHSVGANWDDPRLKEYDSLLGAPILRLNETIASTTGDVSLSLHETVVETPRKDGLGWLDELADYTTAVDGVHHVRIPVRGLVINDDTVIWAAPLELFSEIALTIRAASPFANTLYFGLTNGSLLYLPTAAAFAEGGYEPNVSPYTPQAESDFTAAVSAFLKQIRPSADR